MWRLDKRGQYSVKSGYRHLMTAHHVQRSRLLPSGLDWNVLWKLDIPPKIKHFLWRACLDLLPTMHNFTPCAWPTQIYVLGVMLQ